MEYKKFQHLQDILQSMRSVVLAFSGGADSTFLLKAVQMSGIEALSVTSASDVVPYRDVLSARTMAEKIGVKQRIIHTNLLLRDEFVRNSADRCFFCKDSLFKELKSIAVSEGYSCVIDGSTKDDLDEFRPGRKAAEHYGVRSPLIEADITKDEIRSLSRELGLETWNKPANTCLATRIPYGQRITKEVLLRVEKAEQFLHSIGINILRVRDHGLLARIEVGEEDIDLLLDREQRATISAMLKSFGYRFVAIDLEGYQSGGMDRALPKDT